MTKEDICRGTETLLRLRLAAYTQQILQNLPQKFASNDADLCVVYFSIFLSFSLCLSPCILKHQLLLFLQFIIVHPHSLSVCGKRVAVLRQTLYFKILILISCMFLLCWSVWKNKGFCICPDQDRKTDPWRGVRLVYYIFQCSCCCVYAKHGQFNEKSFHSHIPSFPPQYTTFPISNLYTRCFWGHSFE